MQSKQWKLLYTDGILWFQMETKITTLGPFFRKPNTAYHIREIAKEIGMSHTGVRRTVADLEKQGFLTIRETTPYKTYRANTESVHFLNLKRYYNIEMLHTTGLFSALEHTYNFPTIVLFGSYAKALDDEKSDIDLCIITEGIKEIELVSYEKKLGRKISLHLFNKKKWNETRTKNPELMNSICNGIVLLGQLEIL